MGHSHDEAAISWSGLTLQRKTVTNLSSLKYPASKKRMINRADSSVFTSAILSQECQCVIIPPSIIVMGLSIGSL